MPVKDLYHVKRPDINYKSLYFAIFLDTQSSTFKTQTLHDYTCNHFFFFISIVRLSQESILTKTLMQNSSHTQTNTQW